MVAPAPRWCSSTYRVGLSVNALQHALKRKVLVIRRRGKSPGRVEIDYYDENDLTALAATLTGATRLIAAHP